MTQIRSAMVNTNTLAAMAEELDLGGFLYLGRGIARGGGRGLRSLLANAFEAVLGAVFIDAGYDAAYHYYLGRFRALPEPVQDENYKGRLQQVVQERYNHTPYYDSAGARGGRHREYTAVVYAGADPLGTGHGTTKQAAEQEAAHQALLEIASREAERAARRRPRARRTAEPALPGGPHEPVGTPVAPPAELAVPEPAGLPPAAPAVASPDEAMITEPEPAASRPRRRRRRAEPGPPPEAPIPDTSAGPVAGVAEPAASEPAGPPAPRPRRRRRRAEPAEAAEPEPAAAQPEPGAVGIGPPLAPDAPRAVEPALDSFPF